MLENLSNKLGRVMRYLKGEVTITPENMEKALRDIRLSLLEADVNFKVVKKFIEDVRLKSAGREVHESLNPYQQVLKIVQQELIAVLGAQTRELNQSPSKPGLVMLTGLQGGGKTTTAGKLALHLQGLGKSVLLSSLDMKRLAAVEQLEIVARQANCHFFKNPAKTVTAAAGELLRRGRDYGYDWVIVDTAGRLHVEQELMDELRQIKEILKPVETVFVADALTGQDAVNSASQFSQQIGIDSVFLTKLDADSRGGAALSIVSVTGKPIKFIGIGEKLADFQKFHPDRLAAKILGMGDMLTLIEKAEKEFDEQQADALAKKMLRNEFNLDDFLSQLKQMKKLGSMGDIMAMLPTLGLKTGGGNLDLDEKKIGHLMAIIQSLTVDERKNPKIIDGRRRMRIAKGSGRPVPEVNRLLKSFAEMKNYLKKPFFRKVMKNLTFPSK